MIGFLLSSCAGVMTMHNTDRELEHMKFTLGGKGFLNTYVDENQNYTKQEVLEVWGQPESKETEGLFEKWRYNQDSLAWAGVIPMFIVPIPLVAPVGKNGVVLTFEGDSLVKASEEYRDGGVAMCGWFLMDHPSGFKFGCFSDFGEEES